MRLFENATLKPLEIWHGETSFGPLYTVQDENFSAALEEFLLKLYQGQASTMYKADTTVLIQAKDFKTIYLTGGKANLVFRDFSEKNFPFTVERIENLQGLSDFDTTIDWGQTAIKVYDGANLQIYPRDLEQFPIKCSVQNNANHGRVNKEKIAQHFQKLIGKQGLDNRNSKLAIALPTKINSDLIAEASTYEGLEGDLVDLFKDLNFDLIEFMNDAVLAARQVRQQIAPTLDKNLVLTLGYGVGAALWTK